MSTIKDLWDGNIRPFERMRPQSAEYHMLIEKLSVQAKALQCELSDKGTDILEKYEDLMMSIQNLEVYRAFEDGFCLGVDLIMDVVSKSNPL